MSTTKTYSVNFREQMIRLVYECCEQSPSMSIRQAVQHVAKQHNINPETVRRWTGRYKPHHTIGTSSLETVPREDSHRIQALEREICELRRVNKILRATAILFATELDNENYSFE